MKSHLSPEMDKFIIDNWTLSSPSLADNFNLTFGVKFSSDKLRSRGRNLRRQGTKLDDRRTPSLKVDRFILTNENLSLKELKERLHTELNVTANEKQLYNRRYRLQKRLYVKPTHHKVKPKLTVVPAIKLAQQPQSQPQSQLIEALARLGAVLRFNDSLQSDKYLEQVIKEAVKLDCTKYLGD